jgi:hypothetical protein
MDKNDYVSYFFKVIPMVCEKYVAHINIPVPLHHEEPMNCKTDYFSYMAFFLDPCGGFIFVVVMIGHKHIIMKI